MDKNLYQTICLTFLNQPYRWGGDDPLAGFDCSGLVQELLAIIDLDPVGDQSAQALYDYFTSQGNGREVPIVDADTGLLFFYGKGKKSISHVALCLNSDHIIEAGGGGSKTLTLEAAVQQNAYVRVRSIFRRRDIVAIVKPVGLPW